VEEKQMKKLVLGAALSALMAGVAFAGDIGVSMANSDTFLTVLRKGIEKSASDASQPVQIEIADDDVNKQLSQVQNFIAAKVDAVIVNPVDTSATARKVPSSARTKSIPARSRPRRSAAF
jgi:inositol transport system substrate-binding protein